MNQIPLNNANFFPAIDIWPKKKRCMKKIFDGIVHSKDQDK